MQNQRLSLQVDIRGQLVLVGHGHRCTMRLSASGRQVVAALGFCIGVAIGLIASWFLLPSYVQFLLYVASIVNPHNPVHVTLLLVSLIVSATPVGFGSTFLMVITAIRFRWWAFPIVYVCMLFA